jgi:MerR family transcriptional regulator, light-induced transcriptional regulator
MSGAPPREEPQVDLHEAARKLGVHYMTAYRYVRTGRLPATQHNGRWRVRTSDIERLSREPRETAPGRRSDPVTSATRLRSRLVMGDEAGSWQILESAIIAGRTPASAVLDIFAPALRQLGDGWERGALTVGDEHRATAVATRLVGRLGPKFARRGRSRGSVLLACAPGELHALPVALLATVLRGEGYHVIELGADTPVDEIARSAHAAGTRLLAIGLSVSTRARRGDVRLAVSAVRAATGDTLLLIGGPAVQSRRQARALGADDWAANAADLAGVLEQRAAARGRR